MTDNILKLVPRPKPEVIEDAPAYDPDVVLEEAKGVYEKVFVIGWDKAGELDARGSLNLRDGSDLLWLIEMFKRKLLNLDYAPKEMRLPEET